MFAVHGGVLQIWQRRGLNLSFAHFAALAPERGKYEREVVVVYRIKAASAYLQNQNTATALC